MVMASNPLLLKCLGKRKAGSYGIVVHARANFLPVLSYRILLARCRCFLALGRFREALHDAESIMFAVDDSGRPLVDLDDDDPDLWMTKEGAVTSAAALCKAEALFQLGNFENAAVWFYRQSRMGDSQQDQLEMKSGVAKCQVNRREPTYIMSLSMTPAGPATSDRHCERSLPTGERVRRRCRKRTVLVRRRPRVHRVDLRRLRRRRLQLLRDRGQRVEGGGEEEAEGARADQEGGAERGGRREAHQAGRGGGRQRR